jgi:hypothetical protein
MKRPWESLLRPNLTVYECKAELLSYLHCAAEQVSINEHKRGHIPFFNRLRRVRRCSDDGPHEDEFRRIHKCACASARKRAARPANLKAIIRCFLTLVFPYTTVTGLREPAGVYGVKASADWPFVYGQPWTTSDHFSKRAFLRLETRC